MFTEIQQTCVSLAEMDRGILEQEQSRLRWPRSKRWARAFLFPLSPRQPAAPHAGHIFKR